MADWKDALLDDVRAIATKHDIKIHRAFIFWYIKASDSFQDADILELITDGSGDAGVDAIIVKRDIKAVKLIQSKFSESIGEGTFNKDELTKLNKFLDYIKGTSNFDDLRSYANKKLKNRLDEVVQLIKEENYRLLPIFITTSKRNPNTDLYSDGIEVLAVRDIEQKFQEWQHGHTPELGEITIPFIDILEGPSAPRGFIANLDSAVMRREYLRFKEKLFSRNVRIFYGGKKKPNREMTQTLKEGADHFWHFNNGITILSEKVVVDREAKQVTLKNPQIINGCQTVSTIGESPAGKAQLFAKIVEIADSTENQRLIDGMIQANNRQNPVDERILRSNHPLQVRLQRALEAWEYYFERKEGQYKEESARLERIANLIPISNLDLLRANLAVEKQPHSCQATEDALFSDHFDSVFREEKSAIDYLLPYLIWERVLDVGYYHRGKSRRSFHRLASYHVLRVIYDNCPSLSNNLKKNDVRNRLCGDDFEMDESPIKQLFDIAYKKYESSKFVEINSGQRDFIKQKDSYQLIADAVPAYLKRQLEYLV